MLVDEKFRNGLSESLGHSDGKLRGEKRSSSRFEKIRVVIESGTQQRFPDFHNVRFDVVDIETALHGSRRFGTFEQRKQRLRVGLARRGKRKELHDFEAARNHVVRQPFLKRGRSPRNVERQVIRYYESHKNRLSVFLAGDDGARFHAVQNGNGGFDFSQFDPVSSDFHLSVVSSEIMEIAVRIDTSQIPSTVTPSRIRHCKFLIRQVLSAHISIGKRGS